MVGGVVAVGVGGARCAFVRRRYKWWCEGTPTPGRSCLSTECHKNGAQSVVMATAHNVRPPRLHPVVTRPQHALVVAIRRRSPRAQVTNVGPVYDDTGDREWLFPSPSPLT